MLIKDFGTIVQKDIVQVIDYVRGKGPQTKEQDVRVCLAATRMLATLGMALGALTVISALSILAANPVGAVLMGAVGVAVAAFSRDVFVISKNTTDQLKGLSKAWAEGKAIGKDIYSILWKGDKKVGDPASHPLTEDTLFRPLWDALFAELQTRFG